MTAFTASCECGYRKTSKTQGLADHGLAMHSCERWRRIADRKARGDEIRAGWEASRVPKLCPHNGRHRHGDHVTYVLDRCRCRLCTDSNTVYERRRTRNLAYGRPPYVDATPVRQQVRRLTAQGMGWKRVARAAGLSPSVVSKLLYGDPQRNLAPSKRVRPATADKLLAVRLDLADGLPINASETQRVVKAIVARGYSLAWICRQVGITNQRLLYRPRIVNSTAKKVAELADFCATHPGTSERALSMARRNGWAPDALWGDADVQPLHRGDDVDPVAVERAAEGFPVDITADERYEAWLLLTARDVPGKEIMRRLGLSGTTVTKYRERAS